MPYRVLVIDDDEAYRRLMARLLNSEGWEVLTASNLASGRELLKEDTCDLVVIDKNLGDGTGLDMARELAEAEEDTAVVLVSAYANVDSALEAIRLGIADFITKPFSVDEFRARIRHVVAAQSTRRQNRELLARLRGRNAVLESLAARDSVTELFNHGHLQKVLEGEVRRANRTGTPLSVMLFDIDDFKRLNDSVGHHTGDRALRQVARLIDADGRASDLPFRLQPGELAARYGGDEFIIVLPDTPKAGAATRAERLRWAVEGHDFSAEGLPAMTVSVGVATYPDDARDRDELLLVADTALQVAKGRGRNGVSSYSPLMGKGRVRAGELSRDERERVAAFEFVLAEEGFSMVFQPIVNCTKAVIVGYEALFRPRLEQFPDATSFFSAAQALGRVLEVGRAVRRACGRAAQRLPEGCLLFVNIHPFELSDPVLLAGDPGLVAHARKIVFEVVETEAIPDLVRASKQMQRVRKLGFRFALDDLGAGYAGLSCLAKLSPDFVKVDMNLVREVHADARTARLLRHIFEFAAGEGMDVIAEGIETRKQKETVMSLGGRLMQGYLFGRPQHEFTRVVDGLEVARSQGAAIAHHGSDGEA